ncbi:acyl-CoA dehydrogenase family protein [Streptomyces phaeochromogenes]|uniref:acyl-CoA dehydrogenase family protein n=1 Tax=Streptomyces phaeochromogenes TaxID=1923 RepID=UPI0038671CAF|nr:acyl-CoA dehydrogenase family protein [Streptomyces phaeochromogenes]
MSEQTIILGLTEDHHALRAVVRQFVDERVIPTVMEREAKDEYPADLLPEMAALGIMGMSVPEEYGGSDVDYISYGLVFEELARGWMGLASVVGSSASGAYLIARYGTEEQKQKYLPGLAAGTRTSGIAMTEPAVGSDLKNIRLTAKRDGDSYIVNGTKTMITQARHAAPLVVMVRTDPTAQPPHRGGMSLMLVELDTPGYIVGRDMKKLGHKGLELCELTFDNAVVPASQLLGDAEGQGFYQMMSALDRGRIYMAGASIGIARASLEAAARYAKQREAFGSPIADYQAIKLKLADMALRIDAARLLNINAAVKTQAEGRASVESAMAKVFASETCIAASLEAMRIHGGYGYTTEFPVERFYRDAPLMAIGEGMNDILMLSIADSVLTQVR